MVRVPNLYTDRLLQQGQESFKGLELRVWGLSSGNVAVQCPVHEQIAASKQDSQGSKPETQLANLGTDRLLYKDTPQGLS